MKIGDIVSFSRDLFFDGAVQLGWFTKNRDISEKAAKNFVFHGPEYHGVTNEDIYSLGKANLMDSATFISQIVSDLYKSNKDDSFNPFGIGIAGYGTGKSHLSLTLAYVLSNFPEPSSYYIIENIKKADKKAGYKTQKLLEISGKPVLVVAIDGMVNFNLTTELYQKVTAQLKQRRADLTPIMDLSPRFKNAEEFVKRNFELRKDIFIREFGKDIQIDFIINQISEHNEECYYKVDTIFFEANGYNISVEQVEDPQTLIETVCSEYCGKDREFSSFLILFDEFGRYLEYAAANPSLAGDSALQQIYQGVQDNRDKCYFLGMIQYELKTYLNRLERRENAIVQRYVTRYDSAKKVHLSSNLETLFAHLIEKKDTDFFEQVLLTEDRMQYYREMHETFGKVLPDFKKQNVWSDFNVFLKVILKGCWPLHPSTVWFLSETKDIFQKRSAISFIEKEIEHIGNRNINFNNPDQSYIYPADLCMGEMFQEILAAERYSHAASAQFFDEIIQKHKDLLDERHKKILAAVMIADKMKVISLNDLKKMNKIISILSGIASSEVEQIIEDLSNRLGCLEWNSDTGRYDYIIDAVPRSRFIQFVNKEAHNYYKIAGQIFNQNFLQWTNLNKQVDPNFPLDITISTQEWKFDTIAATKDNLDVSLNNIFINWKNSIEPGQLRGNIVFYLIQKDSNDIEKVKEEISNKIEITAHKNRAEKFPVMFVLVDDYTGELCETLAKLHLLKNKISEEDKNRFRKFIGSEERILINRLEELSKELLKMRYYVTSSGIELSETRINNAAREIFEQIYPAVIPFPFDGFKNCNTMNNAVKSSLLIMRSLILNQIDNNWFANQISENKNKASTLLREWGILSNDCTISHIPSHEILKIITEEFEDALKKDGSVSLAELFYKLIAPLYGMNTSSASLFVAYLIGKETPSKSIIYDSQVIKEEIWLNYVLPDKAKYFSLEALKKTRVCYVSGDVVSEWKELLVKSLDETCYQNILDYYKNILNMSAKNPIPAELIDKKILFEKKVEEAERNIKSYNKDVDFYLSKLPEHKEHNRVQKILQILSSMKDRLKKMEERAETWTNSQLQYVENIYNEYRVYLIDNIPDWIKRQKCITLEGWGDFRQTIDQYIHYLDNIDMKDNREKLEKRKMSVHNQLQKRQKIETIINNANNFLKLNRSIENRTCNELENLKKELGCIINEIDKESSLSNDQEIIDLRLELEKAKLKFKNKINECNNELYDITQIVPHSLEEMNLVLANLQKLSRFYEDHPENFQYVQELLLQMKAISKAVGRWNDISGSSDFLGKQLENEISDSLADEKLEHSDFEVEKILRYFKQEIIKNRNEKSEKWITTNLKVINNVDKLSLNQCNNFILSFENVPDYISESDKKKIFEVNIRINEQKKRLLTTQYINNNLPSLSRIESLTREKCESYLNNSKNIPFDINEEGIKHINLIKERLEKRIYELNFENLKNRIAHLPIEKQKEIFEMLRKNLALS